MPRQDRRLYFDHAATSFPKPPGVIRAMADYHEGLGASPGRGAYREAQESAALLWECRERIVRLLGAEDPAQVVFTLNTSDALNLGIRGVLEPRLMRGKPVHAVTTAMDHNSVLRPLNALVERWGGRLTTTMVEADGRGIVDPSAIGAAIQADTALVAICHASNVTGSLQDLAAIGERCRSAGVPLLVDAAQTAGHLPIDVEAMGVDLLAAPGHKGLLGPLGTGFLWIRSGLEERMHTVREGGTGSKSEDDRQPTAMPDRFEPGSHNTPGIIGLSAGIACLLDRGLDAVAEHERQLATAFLDELSVGGWPEGLRLLGPQGVEDRVGVFAFTLDGVTPLEAADALEREHGLLVRPGLHCAPHAHRTMGTDPASALQRGLSEDHAGAFRLSFGQSHTEDDVRVAAAAIRAVSAKRYAVAEGR